MQNEFKWSTKEFNEILYFYNLQDLTYENAWKSELEQKDSETNEEVKTETLQQGNEQIPTISEHEQDPLELKGIIDHLIAASKHSFSQLSISQKQFKPQVFLHEIHRETSFANLLKGMDNLQVTIQQRIERLSEAVKKNFARFVEARGKVSQIQTNLQNNNLERHFAQFHQLLTETQNATQKLFEPLTSTSEQENSINRKLALITEFEPLLAANSQIVSLFKAEKYEQCGMVYQRAKEVYSHLEKTETVEKIWSSVENSAKRVKDEILQELKSDRALQSEIPTLLVTLALLNFPGDPLGIYLVDQKEKYDRFLCDAFSSKSSAVNFDENSKLERKLQALLVSQEYCHLREVLESLEHSNMKAGVKVFHSLCEKVISITDDLVSSFGKSENKKIVKMVSNCISERQKCIDFLFKAFSAYFEERLELFFEIGQDFSLALCKVQKAIDIFTHLTDLSAYLEEVQKSESIAKLRSLIGFFVGKAAKYCILLFSSCPNYEQAENWLMNADSSCTKAFEWKFGLFIFLAKSICTFFSFGGGEEQSENLVFYTNELCEKFNEISKFFVSKCEQSKEETLGVLKNVQIDIQQKKQFLSQNNELMLKCISNCYCYANNFGESFLETCRKFGISQRLAVDSTKSHLNAMEACIECFLAVNRFEICKIISEGLAIGIYDYSLTVLPKKIRNYTFHCLVLLVQLLSQMTTFRAFMVERILLKMIQLFFEHFAGQIQRIPQMDSRGLGLHGILLLKAEFSFFQSILSHWTTEECQVSLLKVQDFFQFAECNATDDIEQYTQLQSEIVQFAIENSSAMFSFPLYQ